MNMGTFFAQNSFMLIEIAGVWRLLAALILGGMLGLERSIAGKHAGMRTYALVSMGSCLFVVVGTLASYQLSFFSALNPLQIAGSIVIGIGFIGSGLAIFHGNAQPELTTAAGIWVAAGVGMAAGFGLFILALSATVFAIITLAILTRLESVAQEKYGKENEKNSA